MWVKCRFIGNSGKTRNCGTWWEFKKLRVLGDNKVEAWVSEQVVWRRVKAFEVLMIRSKFIISIYWMSAMTQTLFARLFSDISNIISILQNRYNWSHFKDEKMKAQVIKHLSNLTQLASTSNPLMYIYKVLGVSCEAFTSLKTSHISSFNLHSTWTETQINVSSWPSFIHTEWEIWAWILVLSSF